MLKKSLNEYEQRKANRLSNKLRVQLNENNTELDQDDLLKTESKIVVRGENANKDQIESFPAIRV